LLNYCLSVFKESDNLWWDAFATEFFEDDAMLTLSFSMEDGPKRYSKFDMLSCCMKAFQFLCYLEFRLCLRCSDTVGRSRRGSALCVVICLDRGADCLPMVQLMPLHPKIPSSLTSVKFRLVLPFWYQLT